MKHKTHNPKTMKLATLFIVSVCLLMFIRILISAMNDGRAYEIVELSQTVRTINLDIEFTQERLNALSSPQNLSNEAEKLGMIPSTSSGFLRLSDGHTWGTPENKVSRMLGVIIPNEALSVFID